MQLGAHDEHADGHDHHVAEEQEQQQGRHDGGQGDEEPQFALDLGRNLRADVGQARDVDIDPGLRLEPLHLLDEELHAAPAVLRIEEWRIDVDHLDGGPALRVQEALIERQGTQAIERAVEGGLIRGHRPEHRLHHEGLRIVYPDEFHRCPEAENAVDHVDLPRGAVWLQAVHLNLYRAEHRVEVPPGPKDLEAVEPTILDAEGDHVALFPEFLEKVVVSHEGRIIIGKEPAELVADAQLVDPRGHAGRDHREGNQDGEASPQNDGCEPGPHWEAAKERHKARIGGAGLRGPGYLRSPTVRNP